MAKKNFNRSAFLTERHMIARQQRAEYLRATGEVKPHAEFLKTDTPFKDLIVAYEVSYQLTYAQRGETQMSISRPETFIVYGIESSNFEQNIVLNTTEAVQNMKSGAGNTFASPTQQMIGRSLEVDVKKTDMPRGLEKMDKFDMSPEIVRQVSTQGVFVETVDEVATVANKKGTEAKMKTNLKFYFRS